MGVYWNHLILVTSVKVTFSGLLKLLKLNMFIHVFIDSDILYFLVLAIALVIQFLKTVNLMGMYVWVIKSLDC